MACRQYLRPFQKVIVKKMNLHRSFPVYLFFFALLIRLSFLAASYQNNDRVDYFEDVGIAINLLEGKGYVYNFTMMLRNVPSRPTAVKTPVYPFLVFLVFLAFGMKNFFALFVIHALLAAFTCVLLYLSIAKFSRHTAVIASMAMAIYPPFIYHSAAIPESTTLTLFLISLFCYGLTNLQDTFVQKRWILISVISGLLAMTEPMTIPFIFLAFFYVSSVTLESWRKVFLEMFIAVLVFAATIAPWSLRNYLTFKEFVFLKSSFGSTLKTSMYYSGMTLPKEVYSSLVKEVQGMDEINEDKSVKKAIFSWILENPVMFLQLLPKNFVNFWWEADRYKNDRSIRYIFGRKLPYIFLLISSMPSMLWRLVQIVTDAKLRMKTNIYHNLMFILIFTYTVVYTVIGAWNLRYHFPVELGMFFFCAETILYISNKIRLPYNNRLVSLKTNL
jgi:4-amino-4-deoxy-L-arabinose transferase-like glycosyltransferase